MTFPNKSLEQCWRWFGPADPIPLNHIRQAGATGIVSALHHIPNGQVWPVEEIAKQREMIERAGLRWSVVESVPVHEDIKRRMGRCDEYLKNYAKTLRNLAQCDVRVVCYNFMPILDWTRTHLGWRLPDGAEALRYDRVDHALFDIHILKRPNAELDFGEDIRSLAASRFDQISSEEREALTKAILLGLPGTVDDFSLDDFRGAIASYEGIDAQTLRGNLIAFLCEIIPVAEECGISMAIHPDDPPFPIFGLPRIVTSESDLNAILCGVDSPANGVTFCTGSLGANPCNDLPGMIQRLGSRIHFLHLRNVARELDGSFYEAAHLEGSTDMASVMLAVLEETQRRAEAGKPHIIPMRPDHGHRMLGDLDQTFYAGYSAIGRLRGLAELRGLECGIRYASQRRSSSIM
jgi:mannonate dehydratase